jgi:8-oxo-dGTP pyrophosphatase MutT (NUDIX family)
MAAKQEVALVLCIVPLMGKVLGATTRGPDGYWGLIGGKREAWDQTIRDCAYREFKEEAGIELSKDSLRYLYEEEDEHGALCTLFLVKDFDDLYNVYRRYGSEEVETRDAESPEHRFHVGLVPFEKLLEGDYKQYNSALLRRILTGYGLSFVTQIGHPQGAST